MVVRKEEALTEHRKEANQKAASVLNKGMPVVLGISSLSTITAFLPFLAVFTGPLIFLSIPGLLISHAILLRLWFVNPPQDQFDLSRRLISRWVPRLLFLILAPWGYGFISTPWVGLFGPPLVFAALTVFTHRYMGWQMQRQSDGLSIHWAEKAFIVALSMGAMASVVVFCAVAYGLGMLVESFIQYF
ncbi:MAG: hypothetical protein CMK59_14000 [Proteobacteria bacterium]|nr:hypothetical protein [Pseudomonadota bacterium]